MNKPNTIRHIAALAFLLLFVVGNSSRQLLHNIFANHKDYCSITNEKTKAVQLRVQAYHCQLDSFVVESAFEPPTGYADACLKINHPEFIPGSIKALSINRPLLITLRGPPSYCSGIPA